MKIYNPNKLPLIKERIKLAQKLLDQIKVKHVFISGSFLYKNEYKDIDVFVITRSKKKLELNNKKVKVTIIDFNDLYSLFYHSISKYCIAKNILPKKPLTVTTSDYWHIINDAVPTIFNQKNRFHKDIRFLILYTEYFKNKEILDTYQLDQKIKQFSDYKEILNYINKNIPIIITKNKKKSYIKRFFYTQSGYYKRFYEYSAQKFLYKLTHLITRGTFHDRPNRIQKENKRNNSTKLQS